MKDIIIKKEVDIIITTQAQKIIDSSKYTIKEFQDWALEEQKISLGGNNASIFLEVMYNKEHENRGAN